MTGKQGMLVIVSMSVLVGAWFGYALADRAIRTNAVKNDCAHYDTKTGEFKWGLVQ